MGVVLVASVSGRAQEASSPSSPDAASTDVRRLPAGDTSGGPTPPRDQKRIALAGVLTTGAGVRKTEISKTYYSEKTDVSAAFVELGGQLTLISPTIITTGETSSDEASRSFGLNAAVLAATGGTITLSGGSIVTSGAGANGAFATDPGSKVTLSGTKIVATADGGHGVMVSNQGAMTLTEVEIETSGAHAAGIATDRGGGTITGIGCVVTTMGKASPALYSTGTITLAGGSFKALEAEAVVIEGANIVTVKHASLTGSRLGGVVIHQSATGNAEGRTASFSMEGGSLTALEGPLFYVTNTMGVISLTKVNISAASGVLLEAKAGRWGQVGSYGGTAILNARGQVLTGDLLCDSTSSVMATLQGASRLTGKIDGAALSLDKSSTWNVTGDSTLTVFADSPGLSGNTISNVRGNGHTIRYDARLKENQWLGGRTYKLADGGQLAPAP